MNYQQQALKLLAQGFKTDLVEYIQSDDKFIELVMELTDKFIEDNIPVRGEQNRTDLSFLMYDNISIYTH